MGFLNILELLKHLPTSVNQYLVPPIVNNPYHKVTVNAPISILYRAISALVH